MNINSAGGGSISGMIVFDLIVYLYSDMDLISGDSCCEPSNCGYSNIDLGV